jgi:hypothetical protein
MAEHEQKDPDGPRFVPEIFEQEHLTEARRKVAASHRRSSRLWRRLMPARATVGPRQRLRLLLLLGHGHRPVRAMRDRREDLRLFAVATRRDTVEAGSGTSRSWSDKAWPFTRR